MHVHYLFQEQVPVVSEVDHQQVVLHGVDEKGHALFVQEIGDQSDEIRIHLDGLDIFHGPDIVENGTVHRDDREPQVYIREDLANGRRRLPRGYSKEHPVVQKAVEFDRSIGRQPAVFPIQGMVNTGYEQGRRVPRPREMEGIDRDRYTDADDRIHGPVEDVDIGIRVFRMEHSDAQEHHGGEQGVLLDAKEHGRVDHHSCEKTEQRIEDYGRPDSIDRGQKLRKENDGAPDRADHRSCDPFSSFLQHVRGVRLNALKRRHDRIEGLAVLAASVIDDHAEPD